MDMVVLLQSDIQDDARPEICGRTPMTECLLGTEEFDTAVFGFHG
jgi:hypothetical protein